MASRRMIERKLKELWDEMYAIITKKEVLANCAFRLMPVTLSITPEFLNSAEHSDEGAAIFGITAMFEAKAGEKIDVDAVYDASAPSPGEPYADSIAKIIALTKFTLRDPSTTMPILRGAAEKQVFQLLRNMRKTVYDGERSDVTTIELLTGKPVAVRGMRSSVFLEIENVMEIDNYANNWVEALEEGKTTPPIPLNTKCILDETLSPERPIYRVSPINPKVNYIP